ncbi:hypothetical protein Pfo_026634 [Paulownia fortunei]|nr:hypothetical protein Pfo_026634 [Paulownia fortunei]
MDNEMCGFRLHFSQLLPTLLLYFSLYSLIKFEQKLYESRTNLSLCQLPFALQTLKMAEAVVSIALKTLHDLLLEETRFLSGVSGEVKGLQTQLKEVRCLLEDADRRQHESKSVLNWIAEIRDLAYRSEDAIETYAVQVSSKRTQGFKELLRRFSCGLNEGFSLHHMRSEISEIKSEIARVTKSMQEYGIRSIIHGESSSANPNENQQWKRQTFPFETEECFVGKE